MKNNILALLAVILLTPTINFASDQGVPLGIGGASIYNGLGISYRIKSEFFYNYYSLGCYNIGYGEESGWISNCGIGYGLVAPIFTSRNSKNSIGAKVSVTNYNNAIDSGIAYQFSLIYSYFFNGIDSKGWNIHLNPQFEHYNEKISFMTGGLFGLGYQY